MLRAVKKNNILDEMVSAGDGVEALDHLFATSAEAKRDAGLLPVVTMLHLNLPKIGGAEVL